MRRLLSLMGAALAVIALTTGRAEAGKADYEGTYSVANGSGEPTEANVAMHRERDGQWTVRLVGQRLPDAASTLAIQTVGADGLVMLHVVCTLEPALLDEECTVRDFDPARSQTDPTPVQAQLMAHDSAAGAIALITIPLERG